MAVTMPKQLYFSAVIEYHDHLIVADGYDSSDTRIDDVKWTTAELLPSTDCYYTKLCGFLVAQGTTIAHLMS